MRQELAPVGSQKTQRILGSVAGDKVFRAVTVGALVLLTLFFVGIVASLITCTDTLLHLPIVISPIAIGAALLVFFSTPFGSAINNHVVNFVFAMPGIILAQFTIVSALAVRLLKSTFDGIDLRYEQVGRTLGCSKTQAFFRVVLPLAKNGVIASGVLTWAQPGPVKQCSWSAWPDFTRLSRAPSQLMMWMSPSGLPSNDG